MQEQETRGRVTALSFFHLLPLRSRSGEEARKSQSESLLQAYYTWCRGHRDKNIITIMIKKKSNI